MAAIVFSFFPEKQQSEQQGNPGEPPGLRNLLTLF